MEGIGVILIMVSMCVFGYYDVFYKKDNLMLKKNLRNKKELTNKDSYTRNLLNTLINFFKIKMCYRTYWKQWIIASLITVSLVLLSILLIGCSEDFIVPYDCVDESKIVPYKDRVCTMEVEYVCGCNGQMYINKCHAESDGLTNIWNTTISSDCKQQNG
jgi:hypothetical protein